MKKNAFIDLVLNWDSMSKQAKIQRLQSLENMMARYQGRKPRIISTNYNAFTIKNIGLTNIEGRYPSACYSRNEKNKIYILDLKQDVFEIIKDVIHEGFHAYVDDFLEGKVQYLRLFSRFDQERFLFEEENLPTIAEAFDKAGAMPLYDSFYAEERLNYQEDSLYMLKMIFDAIDNVKDALTLRGAVVMSLAFYCDNERRGREQERKHGFKYDDLVLSALQEKGDEAEKCDMSKTGKIVTEIEPELLNVFDKLTSAYQRIFAIRSNVLMMTSAREAEEDRLMEELNVLYCEYVKGMLKAKKKS